VRLFNESVPIGGSILSRTDADAKDDSAISIAYIIGKPVLFFGHRARLPEPGQVRAAVAGGQTAGRG
jgi:signal recognition particle GTPase